MLYDLEHYIYHSGYGPTNETLGRFIRELFGQNIGRCRDGERHGRHHGDGGHRPARRAEVMRRASSSVVTLGLLQTTATADVRAKSPPHADARRAGRPQGRPDHLHAGIVRFAVLLPVGGSRSFQTRRIHSRPKHRCVPQTGPQAPVVVIASLFEKRAAGVYHNTAAIIDADGSLLGMYRKMHIPDDPLYYEKFYFTPGDLGFRAWDTRYGRIGVLICWDQWYPGGRPADRAAGRADSVLPHRHRLASRRKRRRRASTSTPPGKPFSASTPSPTGVSSPPSTASATRRPWAATALSSGGKVSSPAPRVKSSPKRRLQKRASSWCRWTLGRLTRPARTGRSFVIVASTPTRASPDGGWTDGFPGRPVEVLD